MKTNLLFKKTFFLMVVIGLFCLGANSAYSQEKKKIIRIIEVDEKGEHIVKEIKMSGDKHFEIIADNELSNIDSITHDIKNKIIIERIKMDSLRHIIMSVRPHHPNFPPIPEFEFDESFIDAPEIDQDFNILLTDSTPDRLRLYYTEKGFDQSDDLEKILEDLEKGTFDPQKWNMKEIEKDKIKEFKTKGTGEVIILGNNWAGTPRIRRHYYKIEEGDGQNRMNRKARKMVYINSDFVGDSLNEKNMEAYTVEATVDSDGECEKVIRIAPEGKKRGKVSWTEKGEGEKTIKTVVIVNDKGKTKIQFTSPSPEEMKMLENSSFAKQDPSKQLPFDSFMLLPQKGNDKYSIKFDLNEAGNVKVIIVDDKGKTLISDEFDHSKGKTEREIAIKDLKSGDYFIQTQCNGKTLTYKLEIEKK